MSTEAWGGPANRKGHITADLGALRRLFTPVMPLASADTELPVINAIRLHAEGGWLYAMATDRYRLGVHRVEVPDCDDFDALIPLASVRKILSTFFADRYMALPIRLEVEDDRLIVEQNDATPSMASARLTFTLQDGQFPDLGQIIAKAVDREPTTDPAKVDVNPKYLASFESAVTIARQPLTLSISSPSQPVLITAGRDFIGLLMPVRAAGAFSEETTVHGAPPSWGHVFGEEVKAS